MLNQSQTNVLLPQGFSMLLTKHKTKDGSRWARAGRFLRPGVSLSTLLEMSRASMLEALVKFATTEPAIGEEQAPIDPQHEVWAAGVTYLRSRDARKAESTVADMYQKVYEAERPELFTKSLGWRVSGNHGSIRIRRDSHWNVPEPELVLVINSDREIVGYCAGNDVSSRDIEGENPLYLPQAKIYNGSCALGHGIWICEPQAIRDIPIQLKIRRAEETVFAGEANTASMKRTLPELVGFLTRELDFPQGVFLMTGTCLVPDEFTLQPGDLVCVRVGELTVENQVHA
jgi:2-dehydro-3-deoxy-D-arabinonate dehydratase